MAPWIQNVSLADIQKGFHFDAGFNSMLIQIVDPDMDFPVPKCQFRVTHQFKFLDVEDSDGLTHKDAIKNSDAKGIANALQHAWDNGMNVVVHCHAGVCRSGAVCEVGVMLGFRDTEGFRAPNLMVKKKLMEQLGML